MIVELVNTGSELMLGRVLNTHQQWLCRRLADLGHVVTRQVAIADNGGEIQQAVREALLARQRAFAAQPGGAVLDGRDIATVIAPDADAKLYVTASVAARAMRRYLEMRKRGEDVSREAIEADLAARDARDSGRSVAPLRQAEGAFLLDTSAMPPDVAIAAALALVEKQTQS